MKHSSTSDKKVFTFREAQALYFGLLLSILHGYFSRLQSTLEIPSNEIPSNERSLIRARYRSLQRAADQPLFPHYYGIKRARI